MSCMGDIVGNALPYANRRAPLSWICTKPVHIRGFWATAPACAADFLCAHGRRLGAGDAQGSPEEMKGSVKLPAFVPVVVVAGCCRARLPPAGNQPKGAVVHPGAGYRLERPLFTGSGDMSGQWCATLTLADGRTS